MMIQPQHAIAGALLALSFACPPPDAPVAPEAPNFDCTGEVVLMPTIDFDLHCDMNPPQILAARLDDDPSGAADEACHHSGGRVLYDPTNDAFYCINIDY
jgi:hypothetical protein